MLLGLATSIEQGESSSFPEATMLMVALGSGAVAIPYVIVVFLLTESGRKELIDQVRN